MNDLAGRAEAPQSTPFVSVRSVSKSYGGAQALRGVSLSIFPGEAHGLVGANGAGKSTLIRILAGLTKADDGDILVDGKRFVADSPHAANKLGMSFIHQELAFVPGMTVIENIMLGMPKRTRLGVVDWRAIARDVAPIAARVGVRAPLDANAKGLSTAENWLIAIARALVLKARLIVMDEPTAALSAAEAERLFSIIRDLRRSGVAVLYVSHRLDEILELCPRVTVFRDGRSVAELDRIRPDAAGDCRSDRRRRRRCAGETDERSSLRRAGPLRARPRPRAEGQRRELRFAEGRSPRAWRPRRGRQDGTRASPVWRRPSARGLDDARREALRAVQSCQRRQGPGLALCRRSGGSRD